MASTSEENVDDIEAKRRERRRKRILGNSENRLKSLVTCTRESETGSSDVTPNEHGAQNDVKPPTPSKQAEEKRPDSGETVGEGELTARQRPGTDGSRSKSDGLEDNSSSLNPLQESCSAEATGYREAVKKAKVPDGSVTDRAHPKRVIPETSAVGTVHPHQKESMLRPPSQEIRQRTTVSAQISPPLPSDPLATSESASDTSTSSAVEASPKDDRIRRYFPAIIAIFLQTLRLLGAVEAAFYPITLEVFLLAELGLMVFDWSQSAWVSPVSQTILQYAFVLLHIPPSLSQHILQGVLIANQLLRDFSIYFVVSLLYEETLINEST